MSLSEVTELRIHGVSGTPPESILLRPHVRRVAGDDSAGFYRPADGGSPTHGPAGPRLEAYSWGNLTSGGAARALWLLLLPFMLLNVASWMRPRRYRDGDSRRIRFGEAMVLGLCRLLALTLTATVVLTSVGLAMDLVAWQCAGPGHSCGERRSYLRFLGSGFFGEPGRRMAIGALVPLLTVGVLWYLARRTWQRYESVPVVDSDVGIAPGCTLDNPGFWYGRNLVGRLRTLHVIVALSAVVGALAWPVLRDDRATGSGRAVFGYALLIAATVLITASAILVWVPVVVRRDIHGRAPFIKPMRYLALLLVPLGLIYAMLPRPGWISSGALPGFATGVTLLFAVQMAFLVLLAGSVALLRGLRLPYPAALAGFATPLVAGLALFMQSAFTAGLSFRLADWLDGGGVPSAANESAVRAYLEPPGPYAWAGLSFFVGCVLVVIVAATARVRMLPRLTARGAERVRTDYSVPAAARTDRVGAIARIAGMAALTDHGAPLLAFVLGPAVIGAVVVSALVLTVGGAPVELVGAGTPQAVALSFMTNAGAYLIGVFAIALVVLGRMAYRTAKIRRLVGIAWDVGTFWPRDAHPLAPPCYAERSVPDLVTRASWLADGAPDHAGVVLAGHSQGSVLAAATVLQLPPDVQPRLALLTYGSPLSRLYGAFFPAFFAAEELRGALRRLTPVADLPRWTNLYFDTDPIGGPVLPEIDRRLMPVLSFDRLPGDTADPPVLGHSDYPATPEFDETVDKLAISIALVKSINLSTMGTDAPEPQSLDTGERADR